MSRACPRPSSLPTDTGLLPRCRAAAAGPARAAHAPPHAPPRAGAAKAFGAGLGLQSAITRSPHTTAGLQRPAAPPAAPAPPPPASADSAKMVSAQQGELGARLS